MADTLCKYKYDQKIRTEKVITAHSHTNIFKKVDKTRPLPPLLFMNRPPVQHGYGQIYHKNKNKKNNSGGNQRLPV